MESPNTFAYVPSAWRTIRRGLRDGYDHLGYVVFVTFTSLLAAAGGFALVSLVARYRPAIGAVLAVLVVLALYQWAVGVFSYAKRSAYVERPVLADTWAGIRELFWPAVKLFFADAVVTLVLAGDVFFFVRAYQASGNALLLVIGVLFAYALLIWLLTAIYHLPLLPAQLDMESGPRVMVILRKSFLLAVDNPIFTVGIFLAIIALAVLCALPAFIGMALLFLGAVAFLLTHALRELFIKYEIVEEESEVVEDNWSLPESWRKREGDGGTSGPDDAGSA